MSTSPGSSQGHHPKILVVDDEPLIADSLTLILSDHSFEALAAYGGMDALGKAEAFSPQLLLTDVVMPDLDGVQLALQLCERRPACKVLFLSGHVSGSDVEAKAEGIGCAFDFVEKPIHPRDLLERVRAILFAEHPAVE